MCWDVPPRREPAALLRLFPAPDQLQSETAAHGEPGLGLTELSRQKPPAGWTCGARDSERTGKDVYWFRQELG